MNRVIDAVSGVAVEWILPDLIRDTATNLRIPATFEVLTEGAVVTYEDGRVTRVVGDDINLGRLAQLDLKARRLVAHDENGKLLPPNAQEVSTSRKAPGGRHTGVKSPDFLKQVADAFARNGYQGVQDEFEVGRRQASRYISRARDAGMIER